jgi:hypothetical protein
VDTLKTRAEIVGNDQVGVRDQEDFFVCDGIDTYPDKQYPLRILKKYREKCKEKHSDENVPDYCQYKFEVMDELQAHRARVLDLAIYILENALE